MALVKVYRFAVWDHAAGEIKISSRMATREVIERLKVEGLVPETEMLIDPALLDENGMTPRNFVPA